MKPFFHEKLGILVMLSLLSLIGLIPAAWAGGATIIKVGSDVAIEPGTRVGSVISIGGQISVGGTVDGDAIAIGNSVVLGREAVVAGNVVAVGGIIVKAKGAQIQGNQTEINSSDFSAALSNALNEDWQGWSWIFAIISLAIFICILMIAMLVVTLLPGPIRAISSFIEGDALKVTLWGLLGLVVPVPLAVLLAISVIGLALIPLEIIVVACAALTGFIAVAQLIGKRMYALLKRTESGIIRETFWGLIILFLIGWLPYVGWMVKVIAVVIGLGGVIASRFGTRAYVKTS